MIPPTLRLFLRSLYRRLHPTVHTLVLHISRATFALYVCRVPLLVSFGVFLLASVPQIQEVLRVDLQDFVRAKEQTADRALLHFGVDLITTFLLCWSSMFWTHYALINRYPPALASSLALKLLVRLLPVTIGALPWIGGAVALRGATQGLGEESQTLANALLIGLIVSAVISVSTF